MHAGINPSRPPPKSIADVNEQARAEIRRLDAYRKRLSDRRPVCPSSTWKGGRRVGRRADARPRSPPPRRRARSRSPMFATCARRRTFSEQQNGASTIPRGRCGSAATMDRRGDDRAGQLVPRFDEARAHCRRPHATAERRIATRYGGRVVTIDTGMLASVYRGCPARSKSSGIV